MQAISNVINSFGNAFNTALSTGLNYKLEKMKIQEHGDEDNADFIHLHDGTMRGETYKPIFQMLNEKYPDLLAGKSDEEKQSILNAMENAVERGRLMLQNQNLGDFEVRVISLKDTKNIVKDKASVYINDLYGAYPKVKNFFKSSSSIVYLGGILVVKNLSNDNGSPLEVSVCEMVSSTKNVTDPNSYDGEGSTTSVYNKDIYVRFFPSTTITFYTKPISELIAQYTTRDDWQSKKDAVFKKISEITGLEVDEIKKGGSRIRCISGVSQLNEEGVMNFDSFRQNCATFDQTAQTDSGPAYGPNVKLANTYIKFETPVENVPYEIRVYELFLVGKSVNKNIDSDVGEETPKFNLVSVNQEEMNETIEGVLDGIQSPATEAIVKRTALLKYGKIIIRDGKIVGPYDENDLKKGDSVEESDGDVFTLH